MVAYCFEFKRLRCRVVLRGKLLYGVSLPQRFTGLSVQIERPGGSPNPAHKHSICRPAYQLPKGCIGTVHPSP